MVPVINHDQDYATAWAAWEMFMHYTYIYGAWTECSCITFTKTTVIPGVVIEKLQIVIYPFGHAWHNKRCIPIHQVHVTRFASVI